MEEEKSKNISAAIEWGWGELSMNKCRIWHVTRVVRVASQSLSPELRSKHLKLFESMLLISSFSSLSFEKAGVMGVETSHPPFLFPTLVEVLFQTLDCIFFFFGPVTVIRVALRFLAIFSLSSFLSLSR